MQTTLSSGCLVFVKLKSPTAVRYLLGNGSYSQRLRNGDSCNSERMV